MIIQNFPLHEKHIVVLRDDLFPYFYGGNKARKSLLISDDIKQSNADSIVTTGGIQSNHCRVAAMMALEQGWPCKLILHGEKQRFYKENGNAKLIRATAAEIVFVKASEIGEAMDSAMIQYKTDGYKPYYIYGGGHSVPGAMSYAYAIDELKQYCDSVNWYPDHIVLASGTGSTQCGIITGLFRNNMEETKVTGISIARKQEGGIKAIENLLREINLNNNFDYDYSDYIYFIDDFLMGGYEQSSSELNKFVEDVNKTSGIIFDTTYSGKALYGMNELIKNRELQGNILFWHTGGIFNYLANSSK